MNADRAVEAYRKATRRVIDDADVIDFRACYPATVVKQDGNTIDVTFDDRERLDTKSGIELRPPLPGQTIKFAKGTRVLVGWHNGDERFPYVSGVWLGRGGLVDLTHVYSGAYKLDGPSYVGKHSSGVEFDTPTVHVKGDVKYEHDVGRGIPPIAATLSPDVNAPVAAGSVHAFTVRFVADNAIPGNSPLFTVAFTDAMPGAVPMAIGNVCSEAGVLGAPLGILATQALLTVFLGNITIPLIPGPYVATIFTSSYTP